MGHCPWHSVLPDRRFQWPDPSSPVDCQVSVRSNPKEEPSTRTAWSFATTNWAFCRLHSHGLMVVMMDSGSFINVLSMEITWGRSVVNAWFVTIHAWLQRTCTLQFWRSKKQVLGFLLSCIATMGWLKLMARCSCRSWMKSYIYIFGRWILILHVSVHPFLMVKPLNPLPFMGPVDFPGKTEVMRSAPWPHLRAQRRAIEWCSSSSLLTNYCIHVRASCIRFHAFLCLCMCRSYV